MIAAALNVIGPPLQVIPPCFLSFNSKTIMEFYCLFATYCLPLSAEKAQKQFQLHKLSFLGIIETTRFCRAPHCNNKLICKNVFGKSVTKKRLSGSLCCGLCCGSRKPAVSVLLVH